MRARIGRILVALVVIGLCGLAMLRGWEIVRFSLTETRLGADDNRAEILRPWINVPGLAFAARQASLATIVDWSDKNTSLRRRDEEAEILLTRPLSPDYWFALSVMRQSVGEDSARIVDALQMSMLLGPNEGYLMVPRGTFALSIWNILPIETKRHSAKDLASMRLTELDKTQIRTVLSKMPESERDDIENYLRVAGFSKQRLRDIDLASGRASSGGGSAFK